MSRHVATCPDLVIPSGSNVSNILPWSSVFGDAESITIAGPSALDAAYIFVFQVSMKNEPATTDTFYIMNNGLVNVTAPPINVAIHYPAFACGGFRIYTASGNVASDRTWKVIKSYISY